MTIAQEMLNDVNDDPDLLKRVITGDESWSNVKVLLTVFFDYHGVVHQEFLPQGLTVNKEYYLEVCVIACS